MGPVSRVMATALPCVVRRPLPSLAPLQPLAWRTSSWARGALLVLMDPSESLEELAAGSWRAMGATGAALRLPRNMQNPTRGPHKTEMLNTLRGL